MMTVGNKAVPKEWLDRLLGDYRKPEDLIGEHGLLKQLTKLLVEKALEAEMADQMHLPSLPIVSLRVLVPAENDPYVPPSSKLSMEDQSENARLPKNTHIGRALYRGMALWQVFWPPIILIILYQGYVVALPETSFKTFLLVWTLLPIKVFWYVCVWFCAPNTSHRIWAWLARSLVAIEGSLLCYSILANVFGLPRFASH